MKFTKKCMAIILCVCMVLGQTLPAASGSSVDDPEPQTAAVQAEDEGATLLPEPEEEDPVPEEAEEESISPPEDEETIPIEEDEETAPFGEDEGVAPLSDEEGEVNTAWYNDADTTFTLTTAAQLAGLAQLVNGGSSFAGKTVLLGADIDLTGREWTPIGVAGASSAASWNNPFKGTLNGQGHTISGLTITTFNGTAAYWGYGLIGAAYGATVQNLTVKGSITGTLPKPATTARQYVGGVVGIGSGATVRNVISEVAVNVTATGNYAIVGGVIGGSITSASTILNSQNRSSVTLNAGTCTYTAIGGIAGGYYTNAVNCLNTGSITNNGTGSYNSAGGILGRADLNSTITNCLSTAASISAGKYPGLIVGFGYKLTEYSYALAVDGVQYLDGYRATNTVYVKYSGTLSALSGAITAVNDTEVLSKDSYEAGETPLLYALNRYVELNPELGLKTWELGTDGVPAPTGDAFKLAAPVTSVGVTAASGDTTGASPSISVAKGASVTLTADIVFDKSDSDKDVEGEVTYQWYASKFASMEYGEEIEGATGPFCTVTAPTATGKIYYYVAVTNKEYTTESGMSALFTINVLPSEGEEGWFGETEDFQLKDLGVAPSAENPFQIGTPGQLAKMADLVNAGKTFTGADGKTYSYAQAWYQQTADLDLNGNDWVPIGTAANPFRGCYDGGGRKITGFFLNGVQDYAGLFGLVTGGEIKDLNVTGTIYSYPAQSSVRCIGIAGKAENAVLDGWTVNVTIQYPSTAAAAAKAVYTGGAAGYLGTGAVLKDTTVNISMIPAPAAEYTGSSTGGAAGYVSGASLANVTVTGTLNVNAPQYLGGVVGYGTGVTLTDCENRASISVASMPNAGYFGGVLGYGSAVDNCTLERVTNHGDMKINVTASKAVCAGGVAGHTVGKAGYECALLDCVNTGDLTITVQYNSSSAIYVGGVQGDRSTAGNYAITQCRNSGDITVQAEEGVAPTGALYLGGVFGDDHGSSSIVSVANGLVNTGAVTANLPTTGVLYVGGVVGYKYYNELRNSINTGTVTASGAGTIHVGGVIGYKYSTGGAVNCVNTGAVSGTTGEGKICNIYQLYAYGATAMAENSFYVQGVAPAADTASLTGVGILGSDGTTVTYPEWSKPLYPELTSLQSILNRYVIEHADGCSALWKTVDGALLPVGEVMYPVEAPEIISITPEKTEINVGGEAVITVPVSVPVHESGTTSLTYQWYSAPVADTAAGRQVEGASGTVALTSAPDENGNLTGTITFKVPAEEANKTYYYVEVTNNVAIVSDGATGSITAADLSGIVSVMVKGTDGKYIGEVAEAFAGGSGTEADPYQIATEAQLAYLDQLLSSATPDANYLDACYVLTADLDFNNQAFLPMGQASPFIGIFDGGGHTISNLYIISINSSNGSGFFANLKGGSVKKGGTMAGPCVVKDLILEGGTLAVPGCSGSVGAVVGTTGTGVTITNVRSSMDIDGSALAAASRNIGGIVGSVGADCVVEDCSSSGTITAPSTGNTTYIGGIAGTLDDGASTSTAYGSIVRNCYFSGVIDAASLASGSHKIGGVAGYSLGVVLNCANLGEIKADKVGSSAYVSGVVGSLSNGYQSYNTRVGFVINCVNYSTLTVDSAGANRLNGISAMTATSAAMGRVIDSYSVPIPSGAVVYAPDHPGDAAGAHGWGDFVSTGVGVLDLDTGRLTAAVSAGRSEDFILNYPRPGVLAETYTDLFYALNNGASNYADESDQVWTPDKIPANWKCSGARLWAPMEEGSNILIPTGEVKANPLTSFTADASGTYQEMFGDELEEVDVSGVLFDYNFGAAENEVAPVLEVSLSGGNGGKVYYQWYMTTGNGLTETTKLLEGESGSTYRPDMTLAGTARYYAVVVMLDSEYDYLGVTRTTNEITISVRPEDGSWGGLVASLDKLEGSGTAADPYLIPNAETLALMAKLINEDGYGVNNIYGSACWKLTGDIDLRGDYYWVPMTRSLTGVLDGNGHTISNMTIFAESGTTKVGLFGSLSDAEVFDLTISGARISTDPDSEGGFYVGLLAGYSSDSKIHGVTVKDSTINMSMKNTTLQFHTISLPSVLFEQGVGGLVGYDYRGSVIDSCDADVKINIDVQIVAPDAIFSSKDGDYSANVTEPNDGSGASPGVYAGGIAGRAPTATITNSSFSGTITAKSATQPTIWMGGIAGLGYNLVNDTSSGTLITKLDENNGASRMAGLVYSVYTNGLVENCASTTTLKLEIEDGYEGTRDVSLLAGILAKGTKISNSWADSTVIGAGTVNVGAPDGSAAENLFYRVSADEAELTGVETASAITTAEALVDSLNTWVYQASRLDETRQLRTWRAGGEGEAIAVLAGAPDLSQTGSVAFRLTGCTVDVAGEYETDENGAYIVPLGTAFTFTVRVDGGSKLTSIRSGDTDLTPVDGVYTVIVMGDVEIEIIAKNQTTIRTENIEDIITSVANGTQSADDENSTYNPDLDFNDDGKNDLLDILDILYQQKAEQEAANASKEETPSETTPDVTIEAEETPKSDAPAAEALAADAPASEEQGE